MDDMMVGDELAKKSKRKKKIKMIYKKEKENIGWENNL